MLDGVSHEHCLYATKYCKTDLSGEEVGLRGLVDDFMLAADHCSTPDQMVFAVYCGGNRIGNICEDNNLLHLPSFNNRRLAVEEEANG